MKGFLSAKLGLMSARFWLLPSVLAVLAILLAVASIEFDQRVASSWTTKSTWIYGGSFDAAQGLLAAIAGSMITVISVAFSITIVAIQQASAQYSPRILQRFTRDRGNQTVIGAFTATFVFTLLILRALGSPGSGDDNQPFVPAFSISVAILLTLICVGLLVYFIYHITRQIQVTALLASIRLEIAHEADAMYPEPLVHGARPARSYAQEVDNLEPPPSCPEHRITTESDGYLISVDVDHLIRETKGARLVWITRLIGEYVVKGTTVARIWFERDLDPRRLSALRRMFQIGDERTAHQDLLYGIRQIADVAVKALSPGINDPTTADQCIAELKNVVNILMLRAIPPARSEHHDTVYLINRPDFGDYVRKCFGQIRRNAIRSLEPTLFLLDTLEDLVCLARNPEQKKPLLDEVAHVARALPGASALSEEDRALLNRRTKQILKQDGEDVQSPDDSVA